MTRLPYILVSTLRKAPTHLYLIIILVINTAISLPYLTSPMIGEADAYGRSLIAWRQWMTGNALGLTFDDWPPLHALFLQLSFLTYPNLYLSPRVLTFLISSFGIPFYFIYIRSYFHRNISLVSTLLFTIFPLRLILGTQTLSEGIFLPFFLLTLAALSRHKLTRWFLALALVSSNIASGLRYEGWFLLPYIWLHIGTKIHSAKARAVAFGLSLMTPVWMTINSYTCTGDALAYFHHKVAIANQCSHPEYFNLFLSLKITSAALITPIPIPFLILCSIGLYGILVPMRHAPPYIHNRFKSSLFLSMCISLPIYYICLILFQVYTGTMEWIPQRYFIVSAALLIPFFLVGIIHTIAKNRALGILLCLFFLALAPKYASAEHASLTYKAFDNQSIYSHITTLQDFRLLISHLTSKPHTQVQYMQSAYIHEETYSIATAYFLGQPQILDHRSVEDGHSTPYIEKATQTLIVEKPVPDQLIGLGKTSYENAHFTVITLQGD